MRWHAPIWTTTSDDRRSRANIEAGLETFRELIESEHSCLVHVIYLHSLNFGR